MVVPHEGQASSARVGRAEEIEVFSLRDFFIKITIILVERYDQTALSEDQLQVDGRSRNQRFENVHPFASAMRNLATGGVGRAQAGQHIAGVLYIQPGAEHRKLLPGLECEANLSSGDKPVYTPQDLWKPGRHVRRPLSLFGELCIW
jgi:hypothetical protein